MSDCEHDLSERETACADGMCPMCLAARLAEAEKWHEAALRVGESLCDCGPEGYYKMTPEAWLSWALKALQPADSATVRHEPDPPYGSEAWYFRELMAMMHGDGGHYHAQHGAKKAYEDACAKYYRLVSAADQPTEVVSGKP